MDLNHFDGAAARGRVPSTAKILISGGFGMGKTTLVGAISEIRPLRTEEPLSDRSVGVDDTRGVIALSLAPEVPIVLCDARERDSVKQVLVILVRYVMNTSSRRNQTSIA